MSVCPCFDSMTTLTVRTHRLAQHGRILTRCAEQSRESIHAAAAAVERIDPSPLLATLRRLGELVRR